MISNIDTEELKFKDLSDERWREYDFGDDDKVLIIGPTRLHVSDSGGHRVLDKDGVSHYIPTGWIHLKWLVKDGKQPFTF